MKERVNINIEDTLHKAGKEEAKRLSKEFDKYLSFSGLLVQLLEIHLKIVEANSKK